MTYLLFLIGLVFLLKGAEMLVDGASSIAKRLKVSAIAIGLTIVAFGTSMPELVVSIFASAQGSADLAIGNIIGSNIANILLILGITAIINPLRVHKGTVWKEIPLALLAVTILGIMANDALVDGRTFSEISRIDGMVLLSFLIIFLYYVFTISKNGVNHAEHIKTHSTPHSILLIILGLLGLSLGGKWVVDSAVAIATALGVSQAFIGLSVIALGTSVPELATSIVAALKKQTDIAVGNIVGSNILNVFWILGASALINPLPFSPLFMTDVFVALGATLLLFIFMFIGQDHKLSRSQGGGFVALYILYIVFLITH